MFVRDKTFARLFEIHAGRGLYGPETWAYIPHAATAYVQNQLWWDSSWFNKFKQGAGRRSTIKSKAAGVRTVCLWFVSFLLFFPSTISVTIFSGLIVSRAAFEKIFIVELINLN